MDADQVVVEYAFDFECSSIDAKQSHLLWYLCTERYLEMITALRCGEVLGSMMAEV